MAILFSDNVMSNFSNAITYTSQPCGYDHTLGYKITVYGGWFPLILITVLNKVLTITVDTAVGKQFQYNTATFKTGFSVPLNFVGDRTNKF